MSAPADSATEPIGTLEQNPTFWLAALALVAQPGVGKVHAFRAQTGEWDTLEVELNWNSAFAAGTSVALVVPDEGDSPPWAFSALTGRWNSLPNYSGLIFDWRVRGNVALVSDAHLHAFDVNRGRWKTFRSLLVPSEESLWLDANVAMAGTAAGRAYGFSAFRGRWKPAPYNVFPDDVVRTGANVVVVGQLLNRRIRGYSAITQTWEAKEVDQIGAGDEFRAGTNVGLAALRGAGQLWGFSAHYGRWVQIPFTPSDDPARDVFHATGNLAVVVQPGAVHVFSAAGTCAWTTHDIDLDAGDQLMPGRYP